MATRPHRNLELTDCVGLQFAKQVGKNEIQLEEIELLIPAAKNVHLTFDDFGKMCVERINKDIWAFHSVTYRDKLAERSWFIDNEAKFSLFSRAAARNNDVPVFTVLVKPVPPKPVAEEKK